jgi:hypothetical protein
MRRKTDYGVKDCKTPKGTFFILIIVTGRILHWPYSAKSENPMYKTRQDAEYILKEYLKFCKYHNNKPRDIIEFEIVDTEEERLN